VCFLWHDKTYKIDFKNDKNIENLQMQNNWKNINLGAESREADECDSLTGLSPKANN
jgi:hypothetical protein